MLYGYGVPIGGGIDNTPNNMNCYFCNGTLDACDRNGWTLDTFDINTTTPYNPDLKIRDFMIKCREKLSEIIFIPRGVEKTNFVKNKIYGRNDLSIIYRAVDVLYRDRFKDVCKTTISLGYCGKRKVQGDGNCYYTSFIFNLLEYAFFSKNLQIIINIIYALKSVRGYIQDFIQIGNNHMNKEEMETQYDSMIEALENLLGGNLVLDIFSLERLFNKQTPYGDPDGIFIPLIYGCRLLLYRYIVDNANRVRGYGIELMVTDLLERIRNSHNMSTADPILLLLMGEDIEYIVEIPFFAYIFKCKQRGITIPSDGSSIVIGRDGNGVITKIYRLDEIIIYNEYNDPYSFVADRQCFSISDNLALSTITKDEFLGIVNCILVKGHYDIIYHSNNVPDPIPRISPIFKELITRGYYADVGMELGDIPSYLTIDKLVNSLLQVKAASALEKVPHLKSDVVSLKKDTSSLLENISDEIIIKVLETMPIADINKLIACKSIRVDRYAEIETLTDTMILDIRILSHAVDYNKKDKSEEKSDERSVSTTYDHLNPSWINEKYIPLFEKYRKQYVATPKEFSEKINTYFSEVTDTAVLLRNDNVIALLKDYIDELITNISNKLKGNPCNILIIGAIEGETNKYIFKAPAGESRPINFIYCDMLLTTSGSIGTLYDMKKLYIKYILDTNYSQIFTNCFNLSEYPKLNNLFDYITFDGGVLGDSGDGTIITIDSLMRLYPLLKQDGKIYLESRIKLTPLPANYSEDTKQAANVKTAIIHEPENPNPDELPTIRYINNNGILYMDPPASFSKKLADWQAYVNNSTLKDKSDKICIRHLNGYKNPLIDYSSNRGKTIQISFQSSTLGLPNRAVGDFG